MRPSPRPGAYHLQVGVGQRLPDPAAFSAYYGVTQALTNAAKHSRASAIIVQADLARSTAWPT